MEALSLTFTQWCIFIIGFAAFFILGWMLARPGFLIPLSYPEEIDLKLKYYYSDWELEQELKRRHKRR